MQSSRLCRLLAGASVVVLALWGGSRSYRTGRFSVKREKAGYHFHQLLARRLREAPR